MSNESHPCDSLVPEAYAEKHLDVLQGIIQRMAANSSAAKNWSITVSSAILAFGIERGKFELVILALLPALVLWALDGYYLALERRFIRIYNDAMKKAVRGELRVKDLRFGAQVDESYEKWWSASSSFATFPFYAITALVIFIMSLIMSLEIT